MNSHNIHNLISYKLVDDCGYISDLYQRSMHDSHLRMFRIYTWQKEETVVENDCVSKSMMLRTIFISAETLIHLLIYVYTHVCWNSQPFCILDLFSMWTHTFSSYTDVLLSMLFHLSLVFISSSGCERSSSQVTHEYPWISTWSNVGHLIFSKELVICCLLRNTPTHFSVNKYAVYRVKS